MRLQPMGARVFVEEVEPMDDLTARAARAGLYAVVLEENKPKPTEGIVVAVGNDPFIKELVQEGDHVFFSHLAGSYQYFEGRKLRVLTAGEITSIAKPEPGDVPATPSS